jgi:signal transduction histidine kinase
LLEKLLDFSDVTEDNLAIELETGDLEDVVRRFHHERLPGVAESLREFSLRLEGNTPLVRFDPRRVRQILDALVDNAIKFTPEGSSLVLSLGTETFKDKTWARIVLEDNGPGIPEEKLPHVFEPFRQGDGSSTREVGGMGMGLSYAKRLAEGMGGRLEVSSKTGSGTTCSLSFPTS